VAVCTFPIAIGIDGEFCWSFEKMRVLSTTDDTVGELGLPEEPNLVSFGDCGADVSTPIFNPVVEIDVGTEADSVRRIWPGAGV
jgi:hypothetical protein